MFGYAFHLLNYKWERVETDNKRLIIYKVESHQMSEEDCNYDIKKFIQPKNIT